MDHDGAAAAASPYYGEQGLSAVFYDMLTRLDPMVAGDIEFYAGLAAPNGRFLELGCGTGRVALALAERGRHVVACDLSPAMIHRAGLKHAARKSTLTGSVDFLLADMTELSLPEQVDAVISPFFSFAHLPDAAARRKGLEVIRRHLVLGGRAALHLPSWANCALPLDADPKGRDGFVIAFEGDAGRRIGLRVTERRFDPGTGRFDLVVEYSLRDATGQLLRRTQESLTLFLVSAPELEELAAECGLRVTERREGFADGASGQGDIVLLQG